MAYHIKEAFLTLQGEGFHAGRSAVFCRFSGCNLWTGREEDRSTAICDFCDTDFRGTDGPNGGSYTLEALVQMLVGLWHGDAHMFLVMTGGEPMLQIDDALVDALKNAGFYIALETNGTIDVRQAIDWICVSPKKGSTLKQLEGNELKLVYPQVDFDPHQFETLAFDHFYLQPMDGPQQNQNTALAIEYCLQHPRWKLSVQTHKWLGID